MSLSIVTLNPIVQKQRAPLLKEVVNYTLFMAKRLGLHVSIYPI